MRVIDVLSPIASFAELVEGLDNDVVVITAHHEPVAFLVPNTAVDREDLALSLSTEFMTLIEQARAEFKTGKKLSLDEMKRAVLDMA